MVPLEGARINANILKKAERFKNKAHYSNVEYVELRSIADIQQNGFISFRVPGDKREHVAKAKSIEAESKQDYVWSGEIVDGIGDMTVVSNRGQITAHIVYEDKTYEIYPLEEGVHAVVEMVKQAVDDQSCIVVEAPNDEGSSAEPDGGPENGREIPCVDRTVRVLVLSTTNARRFNNNIQGVAQLAVSQFNQAQGNSQVNGLLRLELAGVANLNFVETNNVDADIRGLPGNGDAQRLRGDFGADLVILLTDGNYGGVFGVAFLGPNDNSAYGIVEIANATSSYTFAHEVGHIYGADHQDCNTFFNGGCAALVAGRFNYGFNFTRSGSLFRKKRPYHTLMHQLRDDYTRVLHFSNPDVTYDTRATGNANHDNARTIEVNDQTIAGFNVTTTLSASIDGPGTVDRFYDPYTWEAVVSCGANYTYRWEYSYDGFTYYSGGTGVLFGQRFYPGTTTSTTMYLRLRVQSGIQTEFAFRTVYLPIYNTRDAIAGNDSLRWEDVVEIEELNGIVLENAYPNPVANETRIGFQLPQAQNVRLDVIDLNGRLVKNVTSGEFDAGRHAFDVKRETIADGLYLYQLRVGKDQLIKRLIIGE